MEDVIVSKGFERTQVNQATPDAARQIDAEASGLDACKPQFQVEPAAPSGRTGQVNIGINATLILIRNGCRRGIKITQLGAVDIYLGFSPTVQTISGDLLPGTRGSFVIVPSTLDIWGIAAGAGASVSFMEVSD